MLWHLPHMAEGTRLEFEAFGSPLGALAVRPFPVEEPAEGEVLVRLLAAPINPADLNTIEGTYGIRPPLPATPGIEGCGQVELSNSPDFETGDLVIFLRRAGTWATHSVMPAATLFKLPQGIDPLQAAMLKVNPATAWRLFHDFGKPAAGEFIVQNAGNSAVSRCVIQLATDLGIRTISFVRRPDLVDELIALGADHVFTDDSSGFDAAQEVMGGKNAALAFNSVGGESALRLMNLLREGGTHITYGAMGKRPLTVPNGLLIFRDIQIRGLWVTRWLEKASTGEVHAMYEHLAQRVAAGKLVQPIDSSYSLVHFPDAITRLAAEDRDGKVLFVP